MTDTPTEPTATADEPHGRRRAPETNHYGEALTHLELAQEAQEPDARTAHATLASAHLSVLLTNEARVANLISWFQILRTTKELTADGRAQMRELDRRIRAAFGLDAISTEQEADRA
jgi:hypothetical protein